MHDEKSDDEKEMQQRDYAAKEEERLRHVEKLNENMVGYQLKLYTERLSKGRRKRLAVVDERDVS